MDRWSPYAAIGFTVFALEMVALYAVFVGELAVDALRQR